jgi:PAS domain S-box-containing protein
MEKKDTFFKIFDISPIPTCVLEGIYPNIYFKEANKAYIALTGRTRDEIIGSAFFFTNPHPAMYLENKGLEDIVQSIAKVFTEKIPVKTAVQKFIKPLPESTAFETLYLEATNTPVLNADGEILFIIRTLQNVSEVLNAVEKERAKDKQLIEHERFLSETQKVARIGSWQMDKNGIFSWSDIHYHIMEVEPGTLITLDFVNNLLKKQENRDHFSEACKIATESGGYFDIELNIFTPRGNERWLRLTGKGELKDGEFVRMYGIGKDITAQKILQQALLESRNQLETLVQTVEGVLFECDAQTLEFKFVSEQIKNLLGYAPEEYTSNRDILTRVLHPEDHEVILKELYEKTNRLKNFSSDYRVISKDGTQRWVKISVSIIRENGTPRWLRGLMIDITSSKNNSELERVEKKVLELNARPSTTTYTVLKTYLQGIERIFPAMKCAIMQVKNGHLYNWVSNSLPPDYEAAINHLPIADNTGSCGTSAFTNKKVIVSDIASDPRWANFKGIALNNNLRSCWSQPLRNTSGEVIATLGMYYNTIKMPTDEEIKVVDRTVGILQVILQDRQNAQLVEEASLLMEQSQELAHFGSEQLDLSADKIIWSKEFYNIFGIDRDIKPSADFYFNALHPEDKDRIKAVIDNFLQTKADYTTEERILWPDGEIRNLRTWGRVRTNEQGEIIRIMYAHLDITESKKIQEELLASESRLRSLVDSQTNYVVRIGFDEKFTYANNKYIEDFGRPDGKDLIGTNATVAIVPQQRDKFIEISKKCIAQPNEIYEIELEKHSKNGNIIYTYWHFIGLTNSKGEPKEIQCIGIDISDRKKAEKEREKKAEELEESKKRYRDLFQLSPQPMWVYDPASLKFLDINKACIDQYGYSREEFLLLTFSDIQPEELNQGNNGKDQNISKGIYTQRLKNGELIKVELKLNIIPLNDRMANLVLADNITERLKYLEALEKQNFRLAEIAWIQSHLVRAPLSRIMGLVNLLQNYSIDSNEEKFILESINATTLELDQIIRDIVQKSEQINLNKE